MQTDGSMDCIEKYAEAAKSKQAKRLAERGGAPPLPPAERHVSREKQLELDTSDSALMKTYNELKACCTDPLCLLVLKTPDLIKECRALRAALTGQGLYEKALEAVVDFGEGKLELTGTVAIDTGKRVCFNAFVKLFAIRPSMLTEIRKAILSFQPP
jgi:hypothetical protein